MKRNKSGISLIVLVITVIVMIILAGSVIISLSNSGIIGKANEAVDANNLKQVQQLASLAWSEAYIDKMKDSTVDLEERVLEALTNNKVDQSKYIIEVTDNGVSVAKKGGTTLGSLIKGADDYGKTVDYTVTVGGKIHNEWKVYYEDETNGYVFLISADIADGTSLEDGVTVSSLTLAEKELYSKFQVGNGTKYILKETTNCQMIAELIKNYSNYANKSTYGEYVIGAIGGPTIELLAAGWNAKGYEPKLTLETGNYGYTINESVQYSLTSDGLYVPYYYDEEVGSAYAHWLASPSYAGEEQLMLVTYNTIINDNSIAGDYGVCPVVCLRSDIPATHGTTTDFSLVK